MRRSGILFAAVATLAGVLGAPLTATAADTCVSAASATYRHTFDGASGKATISAVRPLCAGQSQSFGLISYTDGDSGQFRYATDSATLTAKSRTVRLDVVVPPCRTRVTAITGTGLLDEVTSDDNPYGAATLGVSGSRSTGAPAHYRGGSSDCSPEPTVTFTSACDGSYRATLTNAPGANVSAAFLTGGRLTRLAPGRSTTLRGPRDGSLTIRVSTFTTYVGSWRPPAAGCTSAPAPNPVAPTTNTPGTQPPPAGFAPSAPAPTLPATTAAPGVDNAPARYYPPPTTATPQAQAARSGMSLGSMLAVSFGLLLIGGGGYFLVRVLRSFREP
ncbi:hypothetical protein M1L60_36070 [Actinoplanes sp. TRM 88003]|uniref:Uncharacterized protein n=1 Tax=Paractinoplanes aksuensis TaxID=2939490 RepID=A0ABT1DYQ6_9ACTN|nr:hypothetical protein [Actinoplanes aksuensis]MCO8276009.1 hypothetical protein [Actinoplanes aksuensis]